MTLLASLMTMLYNMNLSSIVTHKNTNDTFYNCYYFLGKHPCSHPAIKIILTRVHRRDARVESFGWILFLKIQLEGLLTICFFIVVNHNRTLRSQC